MNTMKIRKKRMLSLKNEICDFIERCKVILKDSIKETEINNYNKIWLNQHPEKRRECIKRYSETEKGRYACSKRNAKRKKYYESACKDLTSEERKLIGDFYKNCPSGYEVDHIIPVSKGGKHKLSNLQYLTKENNRKKKQ